MDRRTFVKGSAAVVGASTLAAGRVHAQAAAPTKIRFGYAITQSGPLGPGAESTTVSQYKLWQKRVNDAGGISLKKFNKKVPIDLVGYDDQGKPDELLKLTERLSLQAIAEAFNLFNVANIRGVNNVNFSGFQNVVGPSFGTPLQTAAAGGFGAGGPRAFQFAARVNF